MVNIYKPKLTNLQQGIVRFLLNHTGESFTPRSLSLDLGVSQPAISKALPGLEMEALVLIRKDKKSKRLEVKLFENSLKIWKMKKVENLRMIYESGLLNELELYFAGSCIILFGSYSLGEDSSGSDIDLAIIGPIQRNVDLGRYEELLNRPINLQFYKSFSKIHKHLKNNILNGIVLSGSVEL